MAKVTLDGGAIHDAASFHAASKQAFGFPEFYGNTIDAWIDCLSYLRDDDAMSNIRLGLDEVLTIEIKNAAAFKAQAPELLEEISFCIEAINERYDDYGEKPALALTLR
jgi:RNAse (barnase) inhibitor barstar